MPCTSNMWQWPAEANSKREDQSSAAAILRHTKQMTSLTSAAFIDFVRAAVSAFYGFNKRQIMTIKSSHRPVKHTRSA